MIFWKDFVLDDFFGPLLMLDDSFERVVRARQELDQGRNTFLQVADNKDVGDAKAKHQDDAEANQIQETGQEQRPARMVGHLSSETNADTSRKEERSVSKIQLWQGRGER